MESLLTIIAVVLVLWGLGWTLESWANFRLTLLRLAFCGLSLLFIYLQSQGHPVLGWSVIAIPLVFFAAPCLRRPA